jgi:hypothetical protein
MSRPRGQPSATAIDHGWPHQVAMPIDRCTGANYEAPHTFLKGLSVHWQPHDVTDGRERYHVFCFSLPEDALQFKQAFGSVPFYPEDRKPELESAAWQRPPAAETSKFLRLVDRCRMPEKTTFTYREKRYKLSDADRNGQIIAAHCRFCKLTHNFRPAGLIAALGDPAPRRRHNSLWQPVGGRTLSQSGRGVVRNTSR